MTPRNSSASTTTSTSSSRQHQTQTLHLHQNSHSRPVSASHSTKATSKSRTSTKSTSRKATHPQPYQPSPLNMVTTSSHSHSSSGDGSSYYTADDYLPSAQDFQAYIPMTVYECNDNDFTFDGTPIAFEHEKYQNEHEEPSMPPHEDRRGRTRERQYYYTEPQHSHYSSKQTSTNSSGHRKH